MLDKHQIDYQSLWIDNSVHVMLNSTTVELLGDIEAVVSVDSRIAQLSHVNSVKIIKDDNHPVKHLKQLKMQRAWTHTNSTAGIMVASIDTGVQYDHPELKDTFSGLWLDMRKTARTKPHDPHGHGTHTMASMVGKTVGTAPGARWMTARACDDTGCLRSDLTAAAQFVLCPDEDSGCSLGAHIISNSYGATSPDAMQWFDTIIQAWTMAGVAVVFAAGNSGPECDTIYSPAVHPMVLSVGAVDDDNQVCGFSSRHYHDGDNMVVAPGLKVVSAWPGNRYAEMSGTSMACPLVAGIVALVASTSSPSRAVQVVKQTASKAVVKGDRCCGDGKCAYGHGLVDAEAAVQYA